MERILRGIMRYRVLDRASMVKQFEQVKDNPTPKAVFYTCMDSRMIPTRFTETSVGDMFVVRNAGNVIPHSQYFKDEMTSCEPAALELGCIINDIRHVIVCGHSDCKAMNLLYTLRSKEESDLEQRRLSPLKSWLCTHAHTSLDRFIDMKGDFTKPMLFTAETPQRKFVAYIDPDNKFCIEDKLSQVNTLQQVQNIASYGMLKRRLEKHDLHIHALWFDIYTGDIYYFSRRAKRFIIIDEASYESILAEPQEVFYACMDTRMIPRTLTKSQIGDMVIGNIIPNARNFVDEWSGSEPAALEFACIVNDIKHVVVCGHSDCKAMNALYKLKSKEESNPVNIIQQIQNVRYLLQNIKTFGGKAQLHIHALWLEIYDGDVYYFSRKAQRFIVIDDTSYEAILSEANSPYSYKFNVRKDVPVPIYSF